MTLARSFLLLFSLFAQVAVAQKIWTGTADSSWHNPANWSPAGVPASGDQVELRPVSSGRPWPVITSSVTIQNLSLSPWSNVSVLTVRTGGALQITNNLNIANNGELRIKGGTVDHQGGTNKFTMGYTATSVQMSSGSFSSNSNVQVNGTFQVTGGSLVFNQNFTVSSGKSVTMGSASVTVGGNASINGTYTAGAGTFTCNGDFSLVSGGVFNAGSSVVSLNGGITIGNNGTYNGQDGSTTFSQSLVVQSSGTVTVGNGSLNFNGDVEFKNTATLDVQGTGTVVVNGNSTFKSSGTLDLGDGDITINGNATFQQTGNMNIASGSFTVTGDATLQNSGTIQVSTGTVNIQGTANFNNGATLTADSATINLEGDFNLNAGGASLSAGSSTINFNGGTWTNNGNFDAGTSTVNLNGGSGQTIEGDVTFYNLNVNTEGTVSSNGSITVLNTGVIDSSATLELAPGEDLNVQGELTDNSNTPVVTTKPFVKTATAVSLTQVQVEFNEAITSASAGVVANYALSNSISVTAAALQADPATVMLTVGPALTAGTEYTLTLNNITSQAGGVISANHIKRFTPVVSSSPPTTAPTALSAAAGLESIALNWTPGNGERSLVLIREGSPPSANPQNGSAYTANANFNSATALGGSRVVYSGSGSSVDVTGLDQNKQYFVRVLAFNGNSNPGYLTSAFASGRVSTGFELELRVYLQGAYDSIAGTMRSDLSEAGLLPEAQPFSPAPFNYPGDEETGSFPPGTVDWVLVDLRRAATAEDAAHGESVMQKAGLLLSDGSVVDAVSHQRLTLYPDTAGQFYVLIQSRNHLPVLAAISLERTAGGWLAYDFTDSDAAYNQVVIKPSGSALTVGCGRVQGSTANTATDRQNLWNARNSAGYSPLDLNLDGQMDAEDRHTMWNNRDVSTGL